MMASREGVAAGPENVIDTMREGASEAGEMFKLVTFVLAGDEFAFHIESIREIIRHGAVRITPIPNAPRFVEGVINLRGRLVPVVDLRTRFGFVAEALGKKTRIVIVSVGSRTLGLVVDRVIEVVGVSSLDVEPLPELVSGVETAFVEGVARGERGMIVVLDIETMFSRGETEAMESLAE